MNSGIVQSFREMAIPKLGGKSPIENDWKELFAAFQQHLPFLYEKVDTSQLSNQEFKVCILTYLQIGNTEMSILINTSTKMISKVKQNVNKKVFNDNSAATLFQNLVNEQL